MWMWADHFPFHASVSSAVERAYCFPLPHGITVRITWVNVRKCWECYLAHSKCTVNVSVYYYLITGCHHYRKSYKPLQFLILWSDFENSLYSFLARVLQQMVVNLGSFLTGQSTRYSSQITEQLSGSILLSTSLRGLVPLLLRLILGSWKQL